MRLSQRPSITLRLTLLFALASTIVLLVLGYLIGVSVERHFVEQDMEILTGKLELAQHALEKVHTDPELDNIPQLLDDALIGHVGLAVVVVAPNGQRLFATRGVEFPQTLVDRAERADSKRPIVWRSAQGAPFRGVSTLAKTGIDAAPMAIVAVATDISHHERFMASFRMTLWLFVLLAAVLTGFLGWIAVRRGLAPLLAIRQEAEGITARKLDARLADDSIPAELADLVATLNAMLSRLEDSFRRLSDFSSDLAHEFRTPISNLMTQSQVTLSRNRTVDEYRDVLASNVEEFERLSRMVADMLFIAKADDGQIVSSRERMALGRVAEDLLEFYRLIADEKGVSLTMSGEGEMMGDPLMMRRAISNLLSNALRHTPSGGQVSLTIDSTADRLQIAVSNSGETIPASHLPRLFDRFYRADPSRHRDGSGSGLGLAIVKSIVLAHGGEVSVVSEKGKTSFILHIPCMG